MRTFGQSKIVCGIVALFLTAGIHDLAAAQVETPPATSAIAPDSDTVALPADETQPPITLLPTLSKKTTKKTKRPPPEKLPKAAAVQKPGVALRYVRNARGYGVFQDVLQFPVLNFSVVTITTLRSKAGANGEADVTDANTAHYLFSPHVGNFGVVGQYLDASGAQNNSGRGGLYYRWAIKGPLIRGLNLLMAYPAAENNNKGRIHSLWGYSFLERWSFFGSFNYLFRKDKNVFTTRPQLGFDLIKGFRAIVIYDYNDSLPKVKGALEPGIEVIATF